MYGRFLLRDVQELVAARDVTRFAAEVTQHLADRDLRPVHQDRAHGRSQGTDRFEKAGTGDPVPPGMDHHQVEILETALPYRPRGVARRTEIDPFLVREVGHRGGRVPGVEIDDEQANRGIHRGSL